MRISKLLNLLPRTIHITLFPVGGRVDKWVWKKIKTVKYCPNCGSSCFSKNRLRCCKKGHWFCMDCSVEILTAVDCPVCWKEFINEKEN